MLTSLIVRIVDASCRHAWLVVLLFVALAGLSADYARRHFAITTDNSQLISAKLDWRQREIAVEQAFPQHKNNIVVVIDAATADSARAAADRLAEELRNVPQRFELVAQPEGGPFFDRNGLLFLTPDELDAQVEGMMRAQPFLGSIAGDPSLRGLARTLALLPRAAQQAQGNLGDVQRQLQALGDAFDAVLLGRQPQMSWTEVMSGRPATARELRRFLHVKPVLDFAALEPGGAARAEIKAAAARLGLDADHGVRVRLTGPVPIADEEFATVAEGAAINTLLTVLSVLVLTWLALRSGRIIAAIFISLFVGLAMTAAVGLAMVGQLNLISVAFAVLFIGIGIDFGIQFAVRYRTERHSIADLRDALRSAAREAGKPLALAAAAAAAGFFSFLPTDYRGVSELGLIAGTGMLIAFVTSISLLPALMTLLQPPGEPGQIGYLWLVPVDRYLAAHRRPILIGTGLMVAAGLPLLRDVSFDFNPFHLRSPNVESVATYLDLLKDPATAGNNIEILVPNEARVRELTENLGRLPEVDAVISLLSFVPDRQPEKLPMVSEAAGVLLPTLDPGRARPAPSHQEQVAALVSAAEALAKMPGSDAATQQAAQRLSTLLRRLAGASPEMMARAEAALIPGLRQVIARVRAALQASPVSLETLPPEIVRDWRAADGRFRMEVVPKGEANDNATLRRFTTAVRAVAPEAVGPPVLVQESADTIVAAFIQAGAVALGSITLLLAVVLRRVRDVFYTLVPLLMAGVVTLELCVLLGLQLNFANIIALPLLLGVGVAFKIYYVLAWNAGETHLLASSLTRAVFFSALTTATAFGSLWLSSHPGTSSMGKLLMLSLLTTLVAAVIFQPILMGPPRNPRPDRESKSDRPERP